MGDGTFAEQPPLTGGSTDQLEFKPCWGDLDGNGQVRLVRRTLCRLELGESSAVRCQGDVAREVCSPKEFPGIQDVIYFKRWAVSTARRYFCYRCREQWQGVRSYAVRSE